MISIKDKGFTLLEVMLAMAVFAIAGVALLGVAGNSFRNLGQLENKMLANWVASNQLVTANLQTTWPPKNNKKGKVTMAGRKWLWQQKVAKTTDKAMRAITIDVRVNNEKTPILASLTTYLSKVER